MGATPIPAPPGPLIDVGGYRMHVQQAGDRGPQVVLDSGLGGMSPLWANVLTTLEAEAQCLAVDRPGYAWSEPAPPQSKRVSRQFVRETRMALSSMGVRPPYVLVGHSLGGVNMLVWAHLHPEEVTGLVLVDSSHPEMFERLPGLPSPQALALTFDILLGLGKLGLLPWLGPWLLSRSMHHLEALPLEAQTALRAFVQRVPYYQTTRRETLDAPAGCVDAPKRPGALGQLPVVWLSADWWVTGKQTAMKQAMMALRKEAQGLSSRSRHVIVDGCDHTDLPIVRADAVREAVLEVSAGG